MKEFKNYIFDFGGVLVDWNPFYLYRKHFSSDSEIQDFFKRSRFLEMNKLADDGFLFSDLCKKFELSQTDTDLILVFRDQFLDSIGEPFQKSVKLLDQLSQKNVGLFGLSNWSAETFPKAFQKFSFFEKFHGIVLSGQEKVSKPDPKIYQILLQRYSLNPQDCVFIDDRLENIKAAQEMGITGLHFESEKSLEILN